MRTIILLFLLLLCVGYVRTDTNDTYIEFDSEVKQGVNPAPLASNFGIIIDPKNSTGDILTVDNDNNNNNDNNNDFNVNNNKNTVIYYQNFNININYNINDNPIKKTK